MALSMDEQRILDEMERNLAADDPRLAARLGSFGQPRVPGSISAHARTIGGVLALGLIAAITVMVFVISPFANHLHNVPPPRNPPSSAVKPAAAPTKSLADKGSSAAKAAHQSRAGTTH